MRNNLSKIASVLATFLIGGQIIISCSSDDGDGNSIGGSPVINSGVSSSSGKSSSSGVSSSNNLAGSSSSSNSSSSAETLKCGGLEYNTATQFCYNSSKVGNFCGNRTETYNPDEYECNANINPNGVYLKGGVSDGSKVYNAVLIGEQTWMAENLNYDVSGSVCYNSSESYCNTYGRLYTWAAARAACPAGWHLPSIYEWAELGAAVGGVSTAGTKLKAVSNLWNDNFRGTDDFGFAALPGGTIIPSDGAYLSYGVGDHDAWWSATDAGIVLGLPAAFYRQITNNTALDGATNSIAHFLSVRCVKGDGSNNGSSSSFSSSSSNGSGNSSSSSFSSSSATPTYTIAFDANSGNVTPTSGTTGTDEKLTSLPTPTITGGYTFDGWFTAAIGGTAVNTNTVFIQNTTIYAHWVAQNSNGCPSVSTVPVNASGVGSVTCGGETYKTVKIGEQVWMAKNLNYAAVGSKCGDRNILSDANTATCDTYGRLYNWATAMGISIAYNSSSYNPPTGTRHQGVCPSGWHLPRSDEWDTLKTTVGGSTAGEKLKDQSGWYNCGPSGSGNISVCDDTYGFSALPGGRGYSGGGFGNVGSGGFWWSSTEYDASYAYGWGMNYDNALVYSHNGDKSYLYSVRCVQN